MNNIWNYWKSLPETSETSSVRPRTVADSSRADALSVLDKWKNYAQIGGENAEMIAEGNTSHDIVTHLGKELGIESWANEQFLGELQILPTPVDAEIPRLKEYLSALGIEWSPANGGSDNHPQFFLHDPYVSEALVGSSNMEKANALLEQFHNSWQGTITYPPQKEQEYGEKEVLLRWKIWLAEVNWEKLIGLRASNGVFEGGKWVRIHGQLDKITKKVFRLWLTKDGQRGGSVFDESPASYAGLLALAQPVTASE